MATLVYRRFEFEFDTFSRFQELIDQFTTAGGLGNEVPDEPPARRQCYTIVGGSVGCWVDGKRILKLRRTFDPFLATYLLVLNRVFLIYWNGN